MDINILPDPVIWAGWMAGVMIGLFAVIHYWLSGKQLGCSAAYGNACGLISSNKHFVSGELESDGNWRLWFLLGLPLGGILAVLTSPGMHFEATLSLGQLYDSVLPESPWAKGFVLLAGGTMMGFGARLAGGCTSGHAISGGALLNPPSLLAALGFVAGGLFTVQSLFGLFA